MNLPNLSSLNTDALADRGAGPFKVQVVSAEWSPTKAHLVASDAVMSGTAASVMATHTHTHTHTVR
jgi:hypothetical protein